MLFLIIAVSQARGDEELRSLELYNGDEAEIVSGSRSPRPASQTAENITVVTSEDILALNAHTLADILYAVAGVQVEMIRTPGASTNFKLQGANFNHVLVLIDNVPLNTLSENYPDIAAVPVQMIERVEIVKGAASSAWGNALGGVINVMTKSPDQERAIGGMASGSYGKRDTADLRGELSGTVDSFGYYLSGGKLRSDGLLANNGVDKDNFYGKLLYDLPNGGSLALTTWLSQGFNGMYQDGPVSTSQNTRYLISTLAASYQLTDHLRLEAAAVASETEGTLFRRTDLQGVSKTLTVALDESRVGGGFKLSWLDELQRVVAGVDYEHVAAQVSSSQIRADILNRDADRFGVYLSDTLTLGRFAVTPSARFDRTGSGGDHFSPSFGVTYALTDNSILRGYTATGYSLTSLNRSDSTEKVWTSQFGFESGDLPYLWVKGTLFRNDTWDVIAPTATGITKERQLKQGVELEAKTLPLYNTSLSVGYTFIGATLGVNGPVIKGVPKHTVNIGLRYQDPSHFRGELTGHYVDWNEARQGGRYSDVIWDLHLRKEMHYGEKVSLEPFVSVRNLLNGHQYVYRVYQNPGRWIELGVRCNF
ncbi:TonB-dependent receptor plug domain-containing protein [Citrifermentans bemidjiense]|nr:TonB-dependent receptor [Citrifermentans bemidjiense]